jgi:hypothetical protein
MWAQTITTPRPCGVAGRGWSPRFGPGQKKDPEFTEKNFVRLLIFFRLLFFCCPSLPVPIETPSKRFSTRLAQSEVLVQISGNFSWSWPAAAGADP